MRVSPVRGMAALAAIVSLGAGSEAGQDRAWRPTIQLIDSPAAEASAQPQMSVSARGVLLSWVERAGTRATLKFAERTAAGWSEPRPAASGDDWFVNWADLPSVVRLANGSLAAHWLQKSTVKNDVGHAYAAFSADAGRTFREPLQLDDTSALGRVDIELMPDGSAVATWIEFADQRSQFSARGCIRRVAGRAVRQWRASKARGQRLPAGWRSRATNWYSPGRKARVASSASARPGRVRQLGLRPGVHTWQPAQPRPTGLCPPQPRSLFFR